MIEVNDLVFDYPGTRALDRVSFRIEAGSITALVGPNGAGKTTLLRCMAALETPMAGSIRIDGADILADPRACHRQLGYLSDFFGIYDELTVRQCLLHAAASRGIEGDAQGAAAARAAKRLGIGDRLEARAGALSRGLRQRLAIAQAIVHQPKILLLDEPASGLDPEARHSLAQLFIFLRDAGMTLVVSSHILSELDEYSSEMLVLRQGRILSKERIGTGPDAGARMYLTVAEEVPDLSETLSALDGVSEVEVEKERATFCFSGDASAQQRLLAGLVRQGVPVCAFGGEKRNMHLAYLDSVRSGQAEGGQR